MAVSATILGCSGPRLTADEKRFFAEVDPWGFILFGRNVETPDQLRALCADLRSVQRGKLESTTSTLQKQTMLSQQYSPTEPLDRRLTERVRDWLRTKRAIEMVYDIQIIYVAVYHSGRACSAHMTHNVIRMAVRSDITAARFAACAVWHPHHARLHPPGNCGPQEPARRHSRSAR